MSAQPQVHCVLLPCSNGETWAVPVNSVAEVVVAGELRSGRLYWRGRELPLYPPETGAERSGGMYAVMLGLRDLAGDYWAICLQNRRLGYLPLAETDLAGQDEDVGVTDYTLAVFALAGNSCVIPDLGALQVSLAAAAADPCR
ncbi:hypothetical protein Q6D67_00100 [Haliea sp. E1-2-M8]|uniref:hypothetical protein n=1 Tax=Haliea sp. E1-2-M8 TaxID=3064706 RepID=UPI002726BA8C|nr:hypothetical protein [Haliea sp. E1-2-M8]MDO8860083.1 hypothetical protein [Haliea sp. E1-2-M8]